MIKNEVDEFRQSYFNMLIKEEKEKEKALKLAQANCFHRYEVDVTTTHHPTPNINNVYQQRTCSKCGHSVTKSLKVWQGTEKGSCTIN